MTGGLPNTAFPIRNSSTSARFDAGVDEVELNRGFLRLSSRSLHSCEIGVHDLRRVIGQPLFPLAQSDAGLHQSSQNSNVLGEPDCERADQYVVPELQSQVSKMPSVFNHCVGPAVNAVPKAE